MTASVGFLFCHMTKYTSKNGLFQRIAKKPRFKRLAFFNVTSRQFI